MRGEVRGVEGRLESRLAAQTRLLIATQLASLLAFAGLVLAFARPA